MSADRHSTPVYSTQVADTNPVGIYPNLLAITSGDEPIDIDEPIGNFHGLELEIATTYSALPVALNQIYQNFQNNADYTISRTELDAALLRGQQQLQYFEQSINSTSPANRQIFRSLHAQAQQEYNKVAADLNNYQNRVTGEILRGQAENLNLIQALTAETQQRRIAEREAHYLNLSRELEKSERQTELAKLQHDSIRELGNAERIIEDLNLKLTINQGKLNEQEQQLYFSAQSLEAYRIKQKAAEAINADLNDRIFNATKAGRELENKLADTENNLSILRKNVTTAFENNPEALLTLKQTLSVSLAVKKLNDTHTVEIQKLRTEFENTLALSNTSCVAQVDTVTAQVRSELIELHNTEKGILSRQFEQNIAEIKRKHEAQLLEKEITFGKAKHSHTSEIEKFKNDLQQLRSKNHDLGIKLKDSNSEIQSLKKTLLEARKTRPTLATLDNEITENMEVATVLQDLQASTILAHIPHFKGDATDTDIKKWFRKAEITARLLSDADKLRYFPLKFLSIASKWHDKTGVEQPTYEAWKKKMIERFHVEQSTSDLINKFNNLTMKQDEKIIDFVERIDQKFKKAYEEKLEGLQEDNVQWTAHSNTVKRDRFIDGLTQEIKDIVLTHVKKKTTYEEAQTLAKDADCAIKYKATLKKLNQGKRVASIAMIVSEQEEKDKQLEINKVEAHKKGFNNRDNRKFSKVRFNTRTNYKPNNNISNNNQGGYRNNYNRGNFRGRNNYGGNIRSKQPYNNRKFFTDPHRLNQNNTNLDNQNQSQDGRNSYPQQNQETRDCFNCGKRGHLASNCFSRKKQ